MFDSKPGLSVPGEVVRMGKSYHGLIEFHSAQDTGTSGLVGSYSDITITTSGGLTVSAPLLVSDVGRLFYTTRGQIFGAVSAYMHPLAEMRPEEPNGRDWSGYILFESTGSYPDGFIGFAIRGTNFSHAYTPDDNSAAWPIKITSSGVIRFFSPRALLGTTSSSGVVSLPTVGEYVEFIGGTLDGRSVFVGKNVNATDIREKLGWSDWDNYKPYVRKYDISGTDDTDFAVSESTIAQPEVENTAEYSNVLKYQYVTPKGIIKVGRCADPMIDVGIEIKEGAPHINDALLYPYACIQMDESRLIVQRASVMSSVVGDSCEHTYLSIIDHLERHGAGSVDGEAEQIYGTEQCGVTPGLREVLSHNFTLTSQDNKTSVQEFISRLTGFGSVSEVKIESTYSETRSSIRTTDTLVETESLVDVETVASIDGVEMFRAPMDLTIANWASPSFGGINPGVQGTSIMRYGFEGKGEREEGRDWALISVSLEYYHSKDLVALKVYITTGKFQRFSNSWGTLPGTSSTMIYIGKTFARGMVDDYIHHELATGENKEVFRAYNPIKKVVSGLFPYPVAYQ